MLPQQPFDDQQVPRIHLETEAVIAILIRCLDAWELVGSDAIDYEIRQIPDEARRIQVEYLARIARATVNVDEEMIERARLFTGWGLRAMDAVHVACAERAGAVILMTDDTLVRIMHRKGHTIHIEVFNPVDWFLEVTSNEDKNAP